MKASLLSRLRCPFCGGNFLAAKANHMAGEPGYGVLACYCGRYPVVAGIPILRKGTIGAEGRTANEVIALIEAGHHQEALLSMSMPRFSSAELAPAWMELLPPIGVIGWLKGLVGQSALRRCQQYANALLAHRENRITACDMLDFYLRRSRGSLR
jgi:hypothetical protein